MQLIQDVQLLARIQAEYLHSTNRRGYSKDPDLVEITFLTFQWKL
jgi:hypothetical protein